MAKLVFDTVFNLHMCTKR